MSHKHDLTLSGNEGQTKLCVCSYRLIKPCENDSASHRMYVSSESEEIAFCEGCVDDKDSFIIET